MKRTVWVGGAEGGATLPAIGAESATDSVSNAKGLAGDASCDAVARCGSDAVFRVDVCLFCCCDAIGLGALACPLDTGPLGTMVRRSRG